MTSLPSSLKPRVVFFTYPSVYSSIMIQHLLNESTNIELVAVVFSTCIMQREESFFVGAVRLMRRCGFRYFLHLVSVSFFYVGLTKILRKKWPLNLYAATSIPIYETNNVNDKAILTRIKALSPHYLLAGYFNQKIHAELLNIPQCAAINIHPSYLPHNKGVDPAFFSRLRNEHQFGVSVHQMTLLLDAGKIYTQKKVKIDAKQSILDAYTQLFEEGIQLAIDVIKNNHHYKPLSTCITGNYDSWPNAQACKKVKGLIDFKTIFSLLKNKK